MDLSGYEIKKIRKALKSAYPRRDKLIVMLREEIDIDESEVPQDSDYDSVLFDLIINFDSKGSINKLIDGARKGNPGNYCLQKLSTTMNAFKILAPLKGKYIEQMKQSYLACCPEDWHINQYTEIADDLEQILDNLEDMPQGRNSDTRTEQFVTRFLKDATNRLSSEELDKLKELGKRYFNIFDKLPTPKDETPTIERTQNIPNHLIVHIYPSKQQKEYYFVSASSFVGDRKTGDRENFFSLCSG
ncbi:effector-associated domain EAD1-containing protein [Brasilonema octagenarum]|uniref:effector-associated domain EAD1-containing protein n=1 Tax=Brasilonema octagenarum TaxID=417105 RepID=UPI00145CFD59|nr:effector-associated domain EAD1-containing protein [Brasilonema octagenarum]